MRRSRRRCGPSFSQLRRYWPGDEQLREAIRTRPFYLSGRGQQRTLILEQLERSFGHPEHIDFATASLTIEHILPQTLSQEWRDHLADLGQDPDEIHQSLVHTLGNLTLTAFNGTLSNHPFERKQQIFSGSHLELNRALAGHDTWGRDEILRRADDLADRAIAVWPSPLPSAATPPAAAFDWSQINAAIATIPPGRWTTYGDLAQLGGTTAMAVSQHVTSHPALRNSDDTAEPAQRMSAAELAALIEPLDDVSLAAGDSGPTGLAGEQAWDWERYSAGLMLPADRITLGQDLVSQLGEIFADRQLPWLPVFRKGYIAFQRSSGYNTMILDLYSRRVPRLAVKLPADPAALGLVSPYPGLEESWYEDQREWGWTLHPLGSLPDLRLAVAIAERFQPTTGPHMDGIDRELVRAAPRRQDAAADLRGRRRETRALADCHRGGGQARIRAGGVPAHAGRGRCAA